MRTNGNRFNKRKLIQLGTALGVLAAAMVLILLVVMFVEKLLLGLLNMENQTLNWELAPRY